MFELMACLHSPLGEVFISPSILTYVLHILTLYNDNLSFNILSYLLIYKAKINVLLKLTFYGSTLVNYSIFSGIMFSFSVDLLKSFFTMLISTSSYI